jgi:GTP cyclohydrolase IA
MKANSNMVLNTMERDQMIDKLTVKFKEVLQVMNFDVDTDQQIVGTPFRMAKMYVNELFSGCYTEAPKMTVFDNVDKIKDMVFLGPISVKSTCSHHFIPFIGSAFIAYIPNDKIVGISKLARVVKWFMRRPQIQEELVKHITDYIEKELQPLGIAVHIKAQHLCMIARGVEEYDSWMKSTAVRGVFHESPSAKQEFMDMIK